MEKNKRIKHPVILGTAAAVGAASAVALGEIYRYLFCRDPGLIAKFDKKGHASDYYEHRDSAAARMGQTPCTRYTIYSDRGDRLEGFYYQSGDKPAGRIAFIVHGFRSDHLDAGGMYYEYYLRRGIDVFTCDNAAAGESGGAHVGYDVYESADCLKWLDFLIKTYGEDIRVILHGFSMGGGTVVHMCDAVPPQVKFIVADSTYTGGVDVLKPRIGALIYPLIAINRVAAGYDLRDSGVRCHLAHTRVPMLFVQGTEDRTVPYYMGQELYELCPGEKDFLWVEGARHVESMHRAPAEYEAKLDKFIEKYM